MIKSNLSVFSFVTCVFGVRSEKPLSNTLSWRFTPVFSSKIFIFWAFIMEAINLLLFSHFYVVCRRSPIYYFMLGYQVISASFVEKTIILYCIVLAFSVQLPKWRVFSWFLSAVSLFLVSSIIADESEAIWFFYNLYVANLFPSNFVELSLQPHVLEFHMHWCDSPSSTVLCMLHDVLIFRDILF